MCGVIKQNQSEVGHIQFSVSYWIVTSICKATFYRKPHWNWQPVQKISAIKEFPKHKETKGNLKINISDYRLILLDHITYNHTGLNHKNYEITRGLLLVRFTESLFKIFKERSFSTQRRDGSHVYNSLNSHLDLVTSLKKTRYYNFHKMTEQFLTFCEWSM